MQRKDISEEVEEFSFKSLFIPFTNSKAIHWIVIIGLIIYSNMLFNGFVADDLTLIVQNNIIHSIANLPTFFF